MITTPNTNSFSCKAMKGKWTPYRIDHLYLYNKKSINEIVNKAGFDIIEFKQFWKILTLSYMSHVFKHHPIKGINLIFNTLDTIPIINRIKFPILVGESLIILKAKN